MSLAFYDAPMSTATITQIVLEELGVAVEKVRVDIRKGESHTPEFLRLNPNGKVPLVVHDGTPIWESVAITTYLGEVFGVEKGLYPAAGPKRGEPMKWIAWTGVTFGAAVGRWLYNSSQWAPPEQHNAKAAEAGLAEVHQCLRLLDEALDGRTFLVGDYSLADTHVNSFTDWLRFMQMDLAAYPRLNAWSQRCAARPAHGRAMAND
jgi:glutathione S-transferase